MTNPDKKALLIILDGFGISDDPAVSAVDKANKPFYDSLLQQYPNARLSASGEDVGLPEGQFGNSEVGHLNIGAGRIVWQELTRVNKSIRERDFFSNPVLTDAFEKAKKRGRIHFLGLLSDGGVHSHNQHLYALLEMAAQTGVENAFVHAFTDGRDTSPHGGKEYCRELQDKMNEIGKGQIASVIGRYFAMDRDNRWERTNKAVSLLTKNEGVNTPSYKEVFESSYAGGTTDEFIEPCTIASAPNSRIQDDDVVVFFNIRGDRARQITKALLNLDNVPVQSGLKNLHYVTFTAYDETFNDHVHVAFPPTRLPNTIGEYIGSTGAAQLRIAETEKYPHVTYFFNGGEETPNKNEERILVPSPKVATYDLKPEMSAEEVADKLSVALEKSIYQLAVVNFANPDMVGHTGDMDATIQAIEFVDRQLKKVVETAQKNNYNIVIIADHGNADRMKQPDGSAHTAHTTAEVPVILISDLAIKKLNNGILADVAPTLLKLMDLNAPEEMTGSPLF
ncbi:2,3-bisphosphoglycerate-independent phosphoglycerate mutase [Rhodohalobacter sp. SW132]|uniref:2,3-bisphosphoglycerate-independent phosphoglycerate mutase n=1 Tax=Rhodohalobacter sp. SW132 TaxID=2293433 RepID=UPI000E2836A9|nr:2,3-bisphosphoglycerate-independent phosphoglycerate mutase [Rhodohalobacter sp. SW132]REL33218.1 2,3-bisphosphoglycerate-independent phosphoglycerate mutase [Rhodohalobacter sp. SW132]